MFAVLKTGGKQYKVQSGDMLRVEKLAADAGETVQFNDILMIGGESPVVGAPMVADAAVQADVVDQIKGDMLAGNFRYGSNEGRIFSWRDTRGTYYICEGHHRVLAALEIHWETGNRSYLDRVLECGLWEETPPPKNFRLPTRSFWSRLLYILGW